MATKITAENIGKLDVDLLGPGLQDGTFILAEQTVEGLISIIGHICEQVGQKKLLRKRVEILEAQAKAQQDLNQRFLAYISKPQNP